MILIKIMFFYPFSEYVLHLSFYVNILYLSINQAILPLFLLCNCTYILPLVGANWNNKEFEFEFEFILCFAMSTDLSPSCCPYRCIFFQRHRRTNVGALLKN